MAHGLLSWSQLPPKAQLPSMQASQDGQSESLTQPEEEELPEELHVVGHGVLNGG